MLIFVQIALVLAVIIVSVALMRGGSNARHLAIRRLLLIVFAVVGVLSFSFPGMLPTVAIFWCVVRSTARLLYGTIVSVLVCMSTTYQRCPDIEGATTKLARRSAI